uniref:Uncharacterized protein n=1 Tax=Arundo donax TaxID=35708 RepID=A0A0A9E7U1_ARUDO
MDAHQVKKKGHRTLVHYMSDQKKNLIPTTKKTKFLAQMMDTYLHVCFYM